MAVGHEAQLTFIHAVTVTVTVNVTVIVTVSITPDSTAVTKQHKLQ